MNKTLASLALLKTNWDSNPQPRDFLDNFVPFSATLMHRKSYDFVDVNTLCKDFEAEYGLLIPYHPMVAILNRATKSGYIQKRNGKYFPVKPRIAGVDFTDVALEEERKYKKVLERFLNFCKENYGEELSEADAENVFVSFLKDHDLDILFINEDLSTLLPDATASTAQKHLINSFVKYSSQSDPETFAFIVDMSVGHIIANTLLYRDLRRYQGNLSNCCFYLDIGFLFTLAGVDGEERKKAYTDFLESIVSTKACLFVFRHTYDEFMGIMETSLAWAERGYLDSSRASRAATYFAENQFTVSDIEELLLAMPSRLRELNIQIVDVPAPFKDVYYQIDEQALTDLIVDTYKRKVPSFDETEKEYTINRDVRSVSAIYKLRRGQRPTRLQDVRHIFVTTNATLAYSSRLFELKNSEADYFFFPAALTDVFVGTLIWIQSPKKVTEISQKRLIANCYAALQPSRALVRKLTDTADRLQREGAITDEDVTLLKQSRVARNLLQEETLGDPNRFTDETAIEILDGIRSEIRKEEHAKFQGERDAFRIKEQDLFMRTQIAEEKHQQTLEELERVSSEKVKIESNLMIIAKRIARIAKGVFYLITSVIVVVAVVFQFYPDLVGKNNSLRLALTAVAIVLTLASFINGFNILGAGERLNEMLERQIVHVLKGRL